VKQDREKGIGLLRRAAQLKSREAKVRLAMIELQGSKNPARDSTLVKTLRKAAGDGSVLAQTMLGYCYRSGLGVAQNTARAVQLLRSAAQRGSNPAYTALKDLYGEIRPSDPEFRIDE
jgi:TPR repeat protein